MTKNTEKNVFKLNNVYSIYIFTIIFFMKLLQYYLFHVLKVRLPLLTKKCFRKLLLTKNRNKRNWVRLILFLNVFDL